MARVVLILVSFIVTANVVWASDFQQAYDAAKRGDHDLAIHYYTKVIRSGELKDDDLPSAYNNRGYSYSLLGEFAAAIRDYSRAIELKPDFLIALKNRAATYGDQGNYKNSLADYKEILRVDPDNVDEIFNRGLIYKKAQNLKRAIDDFTSFIATRSMDPAGHVARGQARFELGRFPEAAADFEASLNLDWAKTVAGLPPRIYALIWYYISRERTGQDGRKMLEANAQKEDLSKWPGPIISHFLGKKNIQSVLAATTHHRKRTQLERECEAFFYLGQNRLLKHNRDEAIGFFKKTLGTGVTDFWEYDAAKVELGRL